MSRSRILVALVLLAVGGVALLVAGRGAAADGPQSHRIVFLFVSGQGAQAKAWYDAAPPQGVYVQTALDKFAAEGFHFAAISSSGTSPVVAVGATMPPPTTTETSPRADYVILLER